MNRDEAWEIVKQYVKSESLRNHMLCVEAGMRYYAIKLGENEQRWAVTGLLHDFDWEIHPTMEQHPSAGVEMLRSMGVPEDMCYAILAHGSHTNNPRNTTLAKALMACDEITGLITAVALVRPSKSLYDLSASSVKKKWKDKAFAAGANRAEIEAAAADFGVELWSHVDNMILAMRGIAPIIGLEGSLNPDGTPKA